MKNFYLAFIALAFITTLSLNAQWSTNSAVNTAICTATGNQEAVDVTSDGSGGVIIAWYDERSGSTDQNIYAQRINSSGNVQWTANGVAICTATGNQGAPQIISDGSGGAIIAWPDYRANASYADVYAQRINSSGVVQWTADGVAISVQTFNQTNPQLLGDGSGGAIITWEDNRDGQSYDIYAQKINSSGVVQWTANGLPVANVSGANKNEQSPQIINDGGTGAIITYTFLNTVTFKYDVYAQKIDASGAQQWTGTTGVAICTAPEHQITPKLISDGSGGAIITWSDQRTDLFYDIYAQRINNAGSVQWTADGLVVAAVAGSHERIPEIISDGGTGAIITWKDNRSGNYDIYAQKINASGAVQWSANGEVICNATGDQDYVQLVSDGGTGAIITWDDFRAGGTNYNIYAQKINASGTVQWTSNGVVVTSATNAQNYPQLLSDGNGGAFIFWTDHRGGTTDDIYGQNVRTAGGLGVSAPVVSTTAASSITTSAASSGGNVTDDGGATVTTRGIIYGTSSTPELSSASTTVTDGSGGTGSYTGALTGLSISTLYYIKAYARNSIGTTYASAVSFTTVPTMPIWGLIAFGVILASLGGMYVWKNNI